jgi:hypothetical protein
MNLYVQIRPVSLEIFNFASTELFENARLSSAFKTITTVI